MRPSALAGALALVALALAPAADANAGGAPRPAAQRRGGLWRPAARAPTPHPIAQRLAPTPRGSTSGDTSPLIALRVRQRGVTRVRARGGVLRMPGNRTAARISLGWLKTGQATTVPLPDTLKLRTGRYLVRLHVKDPRGDTLARSAMYPGRARIIVRHRKPAPAVAPHAGRQRHRPLSRPSLRSRPRPRRSSPCPRRRPADRRCSRSRERSTSAAPTRASARAAKAMCTRARTSSPPPERPSSRPTPG